MISPPRRPPPPPTRIVTGTGSSLEPSPAVEPLSSMTAAPSDTVTAAMPRFATARPGARASTRTPRGTSARPDATAVACISLSRCTSRPGDGWAFTRRAARSTACTRSSRCQPARVLSIVASSASRVPPRSTPSHNISHTRSADVVWRTEDCAAARSRSSMTPPSTTALDDGELSRMTTTAVGSCAPPLTPAFRRLTRGRAAANTIATIKAVRRMSRRR